MNSKSKNVQGAQYFLNNPSGISLKKLEGATPLKELGFYSKGSRKIEKAQKYKRLLEHLKYYYTYEESTGSFYVKRLKPWAKKKVGEKIGSIVGRIGRNAYLAHEIHGKPYKIHHLVWLWHTGYWPIDQIDHINGDKLDNRFVNLREVDNSTNQRNRSVRINNTSGYTGISFMSDRRKWVIQLRLAPKENPKKIGSFDTLDEAVDYRNKYLQEHPELNYILRGEK